MIDELKLLRGEGCAVGDHIMLRHPTVGEICQYGEERYYGMVSCLCATPWDYRVPLLDQFGVDYEELGELEFFHILCRGLPSSGTSILFGDFSLDCLAPASRGQDEEFVLHHKALGTILDHGLYRLMTSYLRTIHDFKERRQNAGNEHTKQYLLDKERRRLRVHQKKTHGSVLAPLISALVNCEHFKYDHRAVWDMPIYAFMDSAKRIQRLMNYNQVMGGVYAGTMDFKNISLETIHWMGSLND